MGDAIVGVVANPLSGRDIRRLVTQASVFPTAEKANMIQRMLTAFGAVGVHRVLLSTDLGGISAAVFRAIGQRRGQDGRWPEVEFLDGQPIRQTAQDTVDAVRRMITTGVRVIICLGGDGTARVTASAAGDVPMLALSTGTNNAFPAVRKFPPVTPKTPHSTASTTRSTHSLFGNRRSRHGASNFRLSVAVCGMAGFTSPP